MRKLVCVARFAFGLLALACTAVAFARSAPLAALRVVNRTDASLSVEVSLAHDGNPATSRAVGAGESRWFIVRATRGRDDEFRVVATASEHRCGYVHGLASVYTAVISRNSSLPATTLACSHGVTEAETPRTPR